MAGTKYVIPIIFKSDKTGIVEADSALSGLGNSAAAFGKAAAVAAGVAAVAFGALAVSSVKAASNFQETSAAIGQVFGDAANQLKEFAKTAPNALGQTQTQFLEATKTFGIFGQAAGLANKENVDFSKNLAILATDLASFNNTSVDDAITALAAGLRGESEPLRRYGVLLDDATLKASALELGIYNGNGALTQQQRVLAANKVIFDQTITQQGDFARTSDGMANGLKILNAQFENLKLVLGNALYPVVAKLIPTVVTFIENLTASPEFQKFVEALAVTFDQLMTALMPLLPVILDLITSLLPPLMDVITILAPVVVQLVEAFAPLLPVLTDLVMILLPPLVEVIANLISLIVDNPNFLGDVNNNFKVLAAIIEPVRWTLQAIADILDAIGNKTPKLDSLEARVRSGQTAVNPFSLGRQSYQGNWGTPQLAEGGIVMPRPGGTQVTIGEAGQAEAVIPLSKMGSMGTTVVINGNVGYDAVELAREIARRQAQVNALSGVNRLIGVS